MNMSFELTMMTPDAAAEILKRNDANRPMRPAKVAAHVAAINRGEWQATHQGIAITPGGRLIDGQHRLAAIVATNQTLPILVARDVPDVTFAVIDTGSARTAGDIGAQAGYSRDLMIAGRIIIAYEAAPHLVWNGGNAYRQATPAQIIERLNQWDDRDVNDIGRLGKATAARMGRPGARSVLTAHWLLTQWHTPADHARHIDQFHARIADGVELGEGDPRLAYRNWAKSAPSLPPQLHLAKIVIAWNSYISERPLKMIKWVKPPMPLLRGMAPRPAADGGKP